MVDPTKAVMAVLLYLQYSSTPYWYGSKPSSTNRSIKFRLVWGCKAKVSSFKCSKDKLNVPKIKAYLSKHKQTIQCIIKKTYCRGGD